MLQFFQALSLSLSTSMTMLDPPGISLTHVVDFAEGRWHRRACSRGLHRSSTGSPCRGSSEPREVRAQVLAMALGQHQKVSW